MKFFKADLHVHTCLSPCADLDMTPKAIVEKGLEQGLDVIAVCDHNSAENVKATIRAGVEKSLPVLAGIEINTREEVHLLAIFGNADDAIRMQNIIYGHLRGTNRPEIFGDQVVVNEFDEVDSFNDHLLIGAVDLSIQDIVGHIHGLGGLSIASHVDRPSFSIVSQLGFIPSDLDLDALEISSKGERERILSMSRLPLVAFSDAHFLEDVGKAYTSFFLEFPSVEEICMALSGKSGRKLGT